MPKRPKKKRGLRYRLSKGEAPRLSPAELLLEHVSDVDLARSRTHGTRIQARRLPTDRHNDKGHPAVPLDSVGRGACHGVPGPARLLPRVSKAPFGIYGNHT